MFIGPIPFDWPAALAGLLVTVVLVMVMVAFYQNRTGIYAWYLTQVRPYRTPERL